jgi:VIT1/CCC1 family predicted Fe2+/Mn2+ transporter
MLDRETKRKILKAQKSESTEHTIYRKLSQRIKDPRNKEVLLRIANDELKHYNMWKRYTGVDEKPSMLRVRIYFLIANVLGITFGTKLMERNEKHAQNTYQELVGDMPVSRDVARDEGEHEKRLIEMIDEERLNYVGAIIRGLSDALIELTGALAGLTLALQNLRLIATAGLIIGIAASLAKAGTEYLATKSEESNQTPLKSALYTGFTYILTVLFLVFPYLLFSNIYISLGVMLVDAILVILVFNFYISVAKGLSFWRRFSEMALLSLGIAAVSFGIGFLVRHFLGVEV